MIEYVAFTAVGLFAVGIVFAIVLAEVRWKEEKRADARREAYARRQKRRSSVVRGRLAQPSLAPQVVPDGYTAATIKSPPQSQ
jgi:hypothetical protein